VCVTPFHDALTVKVDVPVGDLRFVLTVRVEDPEVVIDAGLKLALARRGMPETLRLTVPEKPAPGAIVTVYFAVEPRLTVTLDGLAERVKSLVTTSVTSAVCTSVPLLEVTVSG
jgi:hypothetical protein